MSFFKNLFIVNDESETGQVTQTTVQPTSTFPSNNSPTFQTNGQVFPTGGIQAPVVQTSNEHLNAAIEIYEKGFDSLNLEGFDFYEFFKSVSQGGLDNPQVYSMAFTMGKVMDKTITKEKLISQADFYVNEITKVYNDNVTKGNARLTTVVNSKENENKNLSNELINLRQQLDALMVQIEDRENKLKAIDSKYQPQIEDIQGRLIANTMAKDKIVSTIEQVKNGINININ
jgi:hypothetical protein